MLEKHREELNVMDVVTRVQLRSYFHLSRHYPLLPLLLKCGLSQADIVLALLRLNTRNALRVAILLVGRPITICPPCRIRPLPLQPTRPRSGDDRLVVRVSSHRGSSCVLSANLYNRLSVAKVGMSVQQLMARGVRRRDLLIATHRGYIELERGSR
jgi:hypothetical protein